MKKEHLFGYVPAIVTPFDEKGEIMEDAFIDLFEFLLARGATCVCVAGDNGEEPESDKKVLYIQLLNLRNLRFVIKSS